MRSKTSSASVQLQVRKGGGSEGHPPGQQLLWKQVSDCYSAHGEGGGAYTDDEGVWKVGFPAFLK